MKRGRSTGKPTNAQQQRMDAITEIGCIVCDALGHGFMPCQVHHLLRAVARKPWPVTVSLSKPMTRSAASTATSDIGRLSVRPPTKTYWPWPVICCSSPAPLPPAGPRERCAPGASSCVRPACSTQRRRGRPPSIPPAAVLPAGRTPSAPASGRPGPPACRDRHVGHAGGRPAGQDPRWRHGSSPVPAPALRAGLRPGCVRRDRWPRRTA